MITYNGAKKYKETLLIALNEQLGNVSSACKAVNCQRDAYYVLYARDEDFKKQADDVINIAIDFVENKLMKQINTGDTTAIIFYLKTIGKRRGYIEKNEVSLSSGEGGKITFNVIDKTERGEINDV